MISGGVKGLEKNDIKFTLNVLHDAKSCALIDDEDYSKRVKLVKSVVVGRYTEVWKDNDNFWNLILSKNEIETEDEFLRSKGWNSMDSSFRLWGPEELKEKDKFLDSKGWNDVDSGFRIF